MSPGGLLSVSLYQTRWVVVSIIVRPGWLLSLSFCLTRWVVVCITLWVQMGCCLYHSIRPVGCCLYYTRWVNTVSIIVAILVVTTDWCKFPCPRNINRFQNVWSCDRMCLWLHKRFRLRLVYAVLTVLGVTRVISVVVRWNVNIEMWPLYCRLLTWLRLLLT